ncbi:HlyD family efflux transporter periplasmic adaptor subunit, partial [Mariniblastus sp.]
QWVDEGTILGVIENSTSLAAVEVARVEAAQRGFIEQANSDWKLEYQKFSRLQSLVNSSATSSLELQEKSALLAQKKATLLQAEESNKLAQAKLEQAIANLKKHNLVAPFKGQVVQIHGKKGTVPQSADPIITLVDLSELEVEMHVPLNRFGQIKQGDSIQLVAFAPLNRELSATVVSVSPLINPTSSTFRCLFRIANPERSFPAGFIVSLKSE